jgi:hypothetical protein
MDPVRQIAQAVLYEGYLLWPYRESSLKNRHRWTIGGVHPEAYGRANDGNPWLTRTECLLEAGPRDLVDVSVRFLHVVTRLRAGEPEATGEEAQEREVSMPGLILEDLLHGPVIEKIDIPARDQSPRRRLAGAERPDRGERAAAAP